MTDPATETPKSTPQTGPLKCLLGAVIASGFAFGLYRLTTAIALSFAEHPLKSDSSTAISISIAVRTLVVGLCTMGTGIFGIASLGLTALAVQLIIQRLLQPKTPPPSSSQP